MLKTSEVARKLNISNSQVQDLVDFGYLPVADTYRNGPRGIGYLFSEKHLESLDVFSILAEIKEKKEGNSWDKLPRFRGRWQKRQRVIDRHEHFLEATADLPESGLLHVAYYLFHLNHYAKTYPDKQVQLYALKNQVLHQMFSRYPQMIRCVYLVGSDRIKVWLCEDCRHAAWAGGYTYPDFLKEGHGCEKCFVQVLEQEYYSLVEFSLEVDIYNFCFHLPYSIAKKWLGGIDQLPRQERRRDEARDEMYFYGRKITRIEENIVPLPVVIRELEKFINLKE